MRQDPNTPPIRANPPKQHNSNGSSLLILFLFVFILYSNTLSSPWVLDDFHNIVFNASLLQPVLSLFEGGRLDRPIARLSFALNRLIGGDNPWGYHLVNTLIHALAAILLHRVIASLLRRRNGSRDPDCGHIALLAALLWAGHPIQTQAVTYIVQRMTSLAGLFYLSGIYCYLRARGEERKKGRSGWWAGCLLSFLLAIASKENAVLFPVSLVLIEALFFREGDLRLILPRQKTWLFMGASLVLLGSAFYFLTAGDLHALVNYGERYFTLEERLLTQPRVLWFYLSLIAWPMPWRFSLEHDFPISSSFTEPWQTLPALAGILLLAFLGWKARTRYPFLSLGILFYLLNHLVESSFLPLEMVFEHRNYIPSMFLFVAPSLGILNAGRLLKDRDIPAHRLFTVVPVLLVIALGAAAYSRNLVWSSPASLWSDTLKKAPRSGRALAYLALISAEHPEGVPLAMRLYEKALAAEHPNRRFASEVLNNMAALHYAAGEYGAAAEAWRRAAERHPGFPETRFRLALALFHDGRSKEAVEHLETLLAGDPRNPYVLNLRGKIRFATGDQAGACEDFEKALAVGPDYIPARLNVGACRATAGDAAGALTHLSSLRDHPEFGFVARLWLLAAAEKTSPSAGDTRQIEAFSAGMRPEEMERRLADLRHDTRLADAAILPAFDERSGRLFGPPRRSEPATEAPWTLTR